MLSSYAFAFAIALWLVEKSNTDVIAAVVYFGGNKLIHVLLKI